MQVSIEYDNCLCSLSYVLLNCKVFPFYNRKNWSSCYFQIWKENFQLIFKPLESNFKALNCN